MWLWGGSSMMLAMNPLPKPKLLLVPDARLGRREESSPKPRRYRLARLRFDPPDGEGSRTFEHLKRTYD